MSNDYSPQVLEVVSNADNNKQSVCETFVYEPTNVEEEKLGYLYIVGEAVSNEQNKAQIVTFLNFIASKTSQIFYKRTNLSSKEAIERTLKDVNKDINPFS